MERVILHVDCNGFYAAVECLRRPEIREFPVVVGGDEAARHGIVLSKNENAKKYKIVTGEALREARLKCPGLVVVKADYEEYLRFSRLAKEIFKSYSDVTEDFGLDESWLDVTHCQRLFGSGEEIAYKIKEQVKEELGITVSVGVSFNKIFAKLGSDMKKPDAVTVITREDYKEKVWPLPVNELLYVGSATYLKLLKMNIRTIGELATFDPKIISNKFGKWGAVLHRFANGADTTPVQSGGGLSTIKSVGNSTTLPRDINTVDEVRQVMFMLSESVAERLRANDLKCRGVQMYVRDKKLGVCMKQGVLERPTCLAGEIAKKAWELYMDKYTMTEPIRSVGVRAFDLAQLSQPLQLSVFEDYLALDRQEAVERAIDSVRRRFGYHAIHKGIIYVDPGITSLNPQDEQHQIHPYGYFNDKLE